ncbi:uncharacterized protein K444DRAFT_654149 [Hyaloscypha bicolor E]|uniref:PXA domain-containing protein n=1 Tax=Hyaloscypha bicolor E TaxID=1095630 RepID=A0A2J6T1Y6_9HELO|nr:uncharacterized protein K444DRAFT_654149 [Hyaloscypha bicolor E]PMD57020.1 hypothetical protein K444DRAFT_654149 [Hyaloscypha bicolor E]
MNGTIGDTKHGDELAAAQDAAPLPSPKPTSSNPGVEDLTTSALKFLSTASTETIGGIAVGLAACTYLILGRVGLVLIGALGGVVLHATWEGQSSTAGSIQDARRETGLEIVKRILDLREARRACEVDEDDKDVTENSFDGFQPETAAALNNLVDAVIRDYVKWWYSPILPKDSTFPAASRQTLTRFLLSISQNLSRKRPADTFLDFLTNSSSIIIVFLNELSSAMALSQGTNVPAAEAIYTYLSANPESNLANILSEKQQARKFKMIAEDILQNFLEKPAYDCDPARVFLREILAGVCLEMTLKSCSKPEWINGWIVYLLEEGEPDFSQAIDAGMGNGDDLLSSGFTDIDGYLGNVNLAKAPKSQNERQKQETRRHKKRLSRAEEAMEEAMEEAKRLSQLIAEEDAKRLQTQERLLDVAPTSVAAAVLDNAALNLDAAPVVSPERTQLSTITPASLRNGAAEPSSPLRRAASDPFSELPLSNEPLKEPRSREPERKLVDPVKPEHLSPSPKSNQNGASFTSFDQLVPESVPVALQNGTPAPRRKTVSSTLHNANIIIYDDSTSSDKGRLRSKPNADYLVQIEPASSDHPGWVIVRRYPDFETLHEVLRRLAQISGVTAFTEQHNYLPSWKEHNKASLRGELERYLRDACWFQPLAESEGMKRFLEKDQGQSASGSGSKNGFPGIGWPTPSAFETMGKGMLDVLTSAPKGVTEGGKVIGGVLTNIGNLGQKKPTNGSSSNLGMQHGGRSSTSTLPRMDSMNSVVASRNSRASEDSLRAPPLVSTQPSKIPAMERRPSYNSIAEDDSEREPRKTDSARSSMSGRRSTTQSRDPSRAPSRRGTPLSSPIQMGDMNLPPPPSDMPDDYGRQDESSAAHSRTESNFATTTWTSTSTAPSQPSPGRASLSAPRRESVPVITPSRRPRKEATPLTEAETRQAIELMFAVINEMYTLSSAWKFRRTLLIAAKTFLLRPGNPSLSSIQSLIQDSIIVSNTSDSGVATHLRKLRENTLPTEDELKAWPPEPTVEEKQRLRIKARKLLVERGVPAALTGVMGQAATGEAMGRIFDCLQVEEVARGLMFGLLLQGVRAVTQ